MTRRRLTTKQRKPSLVQARLIAKLWGQDREIIVSDASNPTVVACIKHEWLVPLGMGGKYPSGDPFEFHEVSNRGLLALETFLMSRRLKTK